MRNQLFFGVCITSWLVGCAAGASDQSTETTEGGGGNGTQTTTTSSSDGGENTGASTTNFMTTTTGGSEPMGPAEVFGHSQTKLYKLNPDTKAVSTIGDFEGCDGSVIDIALDEKSTLYGVTYDSLYTIDRETAECHFIASGSFPNSLSFVPAGTLDANKEALVGFVDDQYIRINEATGQVTEIGAPWNDGTISSGDIVSVKGGPTYLTIKDEDSGSDNCRDCLVLINPKTGAKTADFGPIGYAKVFGTAFWAGSVYGFDNEGHLFEITVNAGKITTNLIPTEGGLTFWGAGSTTNAPPVPR